MIIIFRKLTKSNGRHGDEKSKGGWRKGGVGGGELGHLILFFCFSMGLYCIFFLPAQQVEWTFSKWQFLIDTD